MTQNLLFTPNQTSFYSCINGLKLKYIVWPCWTHFHRWTLYLETSLASIYIKILYWKCMNIYNDQHFMEQWSTLRRITLQEYQTVKHCISFLQHFVLMLVLIAGHMTCHSSMYKSLWMCMNSRLKTIISSWRVSSRLITLSYKQVFSTCRWFRRWRSWLRFWLWGPILFI